MVDATLAPSAQPPQAHKRRNGLPLLCGCAGRWRRHPRGRRAPCLSSRLARFRLARPGGREIVVSSITLDCRLVWKFLNVRGKPVVAVAPTPAAALGTTPGKTRRHARAPGCMADGRLPQPACGAAPEAPRLSAPPFFAADRTYGPGTVYVPGVCAAYSDSYDNGASHARAQCAVSSASSQRARSQSSSRGG